MEIKTCKKEESVELLVTCEIMSICLRDLVTKVIKTFVCFKHFLDFTFKTETQAYHKRVSRMTINCHIKMSGNVRHMRKNNMPA